MTGTRPIASVQATVLRRFRVAIVGAACATCLISCKTRESDSHATPGNESAANSQGPAQAEHTSEETPKRIVIERASEDVDRWVFVEHLTDGSKGGWATGSFDGDRNRLSIETRDVQGFALDSDKIAIDWSRPVILHLNGRTSELRKRDFTRLHFTLDDQGRWIVIEP